MDTKTKIWVISLSTATERRAQFQQTVAASAIDWSFFDAHTALQGDLRYSAPNSIVHHGRTLRNGELGAYSSHYALWQWLLTSDCEQIVVFEDDVQVDWEYLQFLTRHDFTAMGIPYLRMYTKIPARWRYVQSPFLDRYHHLIRFTSYALGTQGYLLTKAGARSFVQHGQDIRYPVDAFMDQYWEHKVANLGIYPFPIYERSIASTIGEQRFIGESLSAPQRRQFKMRRLQDKLRMWAAYFGPEPSMVKAHKSAAPVLFNIETAAK